MFYFNIIIFGFLHLETMVQNFEEHFTIRTKHTLNNFLFKTSFHRKKLNNFDATESNLEKGSFITHIQFSSWRESAF